MVKSRRQPNKSLEPTANQRASHPQDLGGWLVECAAAQFRRSAARVEVENSAADLPHARGARLFSFQLNDFLARCDAALRGIFDAASRSLSGSFREVWQMVNGFSPGAAEQLIAAERE